MILTHGTYYEYSAGPECELTFYLLLADPLVLSHSLFGLTSSDPSFATKLGVLQTRQTQKMCLSSAAASSGAMFSTKHWRREESSQLDRTQVWVWAATSKVVVMGPSQVPTVWPPSRSCR